MFDTLALQVPAFHRLSDYFGLWAVEVTSFLSQWSLASQTDLYAHVAASQPPKLGSALSMVPAKNGKSIGVVNVSGTLMKQSPSMGGTSTVQIRRDIRAAASDPNVSGILLRIDSPGGTVAGTSDLAADVKAARKAKPVWAHVEDMAASAAYWIASQADAVYANSPTAHVGSIGTLLTVYDMSAAAEREGVKTLVFKTGPLKGVGTPGAAVTDEQSTHLQSLVNEMQTHFDAAVRSGRGLSASELASVKTGGVFSASEAVDRRLIDGIRSLDSTIAALGAAK